MRYACVSPAVFCDRPNRFIAHVLLDGVLQTVHVKNTGRCRELLVPGTTVYLAKAQNPLRKTAFDLIATEKKTEHGTLLINMDSQIVNDVAEEFLQGTAFFGKDASLRREVTHGKSRFDFAVEQNGRTAFLEVKGCTLEQDGVAMFPDAPTERGTKHLLELADWCRQGNEAYVLIVIQMKGVRYFTPFALRDPAFAAAMQKAYAAGVKISAVDCMVTPDSIRADRPIPVHLGGDAFG